MATVFNEIRQGKLKEDTVLSEDVAILNREFYIDPDEAEEFSGTITYSVDDALSEMITISDNDAALLLSEKVGLSNIKNFLTQNGFIDSKVGENGQDPLTSASDIALFFEKFYNGQLL